MGRIVVGVDGSDASRRALEWSVAEARLREAEVVAVHGWSLPIIPGPMGTYVPPPPSDQMQTEAERVLEDELTRLGDAAGGVRITRQVVEMPPARALLRAAQGADMLVVGSRGLGGFRGLLLGSVGHQCAQHATCPVVIVPHDERGSADS
jgi:nucleotide-binding universal stress UspA family protein